MGSAVQNQTECAHGRGQSPNGRGADLVAHDCALQLQLRMEMTYWYDGWFLQWHGKEGSTRPESNLVVCFGNVVQQMDG